MAAVWLGAILLATPAAATNLRDLVEGCEDYALSGNPVPSFGNPAGGYPQPNMSYRYVAIYTPTGAPIKLAMDEDTGGGQFSRTCVVTWGRLAEVDVDAIAAQFAGLVSDKAYTQVPDAQPRFVRAGLERCEDGLYLSGGAFSRNGTDLQIVIASTDIQNEFCQGGTS
ncbi:hypothetical protein [Algirhabdus cladophorae]|uniref:hypothetical protein n=1 Tax=Algirhabdus cladophorae TaxID=3377108 RepID=UPI003B845284